MRALTLVLLVACGSSAKPAPPEKRLDQQKPLRLVYCVDAEQGSASAVAEQIRARLPDRDVVEVIANTDEIVVELHDRGDAGPMDRDQAAAELAAVLRDGELPRPGPCERGAR